MNIYDIRTELETVASVKKIDIVNLILYTNQHFCTEIHYWPNLEAITVTLFSQQAYNNRIASKLSDMYLIKTIFHLPVDPADLIEAEAENKKCPF